MVSSKLIKLKEMIRVMWLFSRSSKKQRQAILLILEAYQQQRRN